MTKSSKRALSRSVSSLAAIAVLALAVAMTSGCTRVDAGYVGIKVNLAGSDRGVDDLPIQTGWVVYNPFGAKVFEYPTFVQTAVWTRDENEGSPTNEEISFNSKEGLIITGDISLSYQLEAKKVPAFYVKFRSDDLKAFTHGFLRNHARDIFNEVAGKYSVEDIYGPKKESFLSEVRNRLNKSCANIGLRIEQFGFVGAPRPPQSVINALNAKVAATQQAMQAENELRREQANAKKRVAKAEGEAQALITMADAQAKANVIVAKSVTTELIQWKAVSKWNGVMPTVTSGAMPMIQLPTAGK